MRLSTVFSARTDSIVGKLCDNREAVRPYTPDVISRQSRPRRLLLGLGRQLVCVVVDAINNQSIIRCPVLHQMPCVLRAVNLQTVAQALALDRLEFQGVGPPVRWCSTTV